ncbi:peptidoglycan DD-metalloendopeptidase family protein [Mucilaginibacter sp.]
MKFKPSGVSTVIIVDKNKGASKTLQVKTKHISRLKHYAAGVLSLIVILAGSIIYLNNENNKQQAEKAILLKQITQLKTQVPPPVSTQVKAPENKAQTYIQEIEAKLQTINTYLKKRGLKGFSTKSVGGNGDAETGKFTDEEKYSLYDDYLSRFLNAVAFTPMGYPRISSLTSYFGYRSDPFDSGHAEFHPGIDFKGERGDAAKCTANGRVVFTGWFGGYGNCVRIQHKNNFETLYGHLSKIVVRVGQEVTAGEKIGEIGSTGRSTGNHLHYEVRKNGKPVNPIAYLSLNN